METKNIIIIGIVILAVVALLFIFVVPAIKAHLNNENKEVEDGRKNVVAFMPETV